MCQQIPLRPGDERPRSPHRQRGQDVQQRKGTDNLTAGTFGPDLLSVPDIPTDKWRNVLKTKHPNFFKDKLSKGQGERLLASARNLAASFPDKPFTLEKKRVKTTNDLRILIEELEKKSPTYVDAILDDNDNIQIVIEECFTEELTSYYIPISIFDETAVANGYIRKETAETGLRFIKAFKERFELDEIRQCGIYDYLRCWSMDEIESYEKNKKLQEEESELYEFHKNILDMYKPDSDKCKTLDRMNKAKALTRKEANAYEPVTEGEKEFKKLILEGLKLISTKDDIWKYTTSTCFNGDTAEFLENYRQTGYLSIRDLILIIYDEDDVTEEILRYHSSDLESGLEYEAIGYKQIITPDCKVIDKSFPKKFTQYLDKLVRFLYSNKLAYRKEKAA